MLRQTSGVISPHQNKEQRLYQCIFTDSFRRAAQNPLERSPLIFYLWRHVGTLKNHDAFRSSWKTPVHFYTFHNIRSSLWKDAMVHDQICTSAHWFRLRKFWTFLVNCDFIYNTNITIIKLGNSTVNVLRQL
jgi:hypothetical protein